MNNDAHHFRGENNHHFTPENTHHFTRVNSEDGNSEEER